MNRKTIFLLAIICGHGVVKKTYADAFQDDEYHTSAPSKSNEVRKPLMFYAGLSGGIERLMGRRTEGLSENRAAGATVLTIYSTGKGILENNGVVSAMGGFLWKFPPLPLYFGLEGYLGRGSTTSNVTRNSLDLNGSNRLYSTDLQRKFFYGGLVRIGHIFCKDNLFYVSVGLERSQFLTKRIISSTVTTIVQRTKGFNGVVLGLGLEKYIGKFFVGLDLRNIQYRRQNTRDDFLVPAGVQTAKLSLTFRPIIYSAAIRLGYRF